MRPFVSVIIPTFNRLALLQETLESVRRQTFRDFEIIVVDDGSTDGTGEWLKTRNDLIVVVQGNSGIASSRNRGAAEAQGCWLAFLDHDDLWSPEKLEVQVDYVNRQPDVGMAVVRHERLGTKHGSTGKSLWICGDLFLKEFSESFIHTSSVMIRTDVFNEMKGFDPVYRFADEFDLWLKIARKYPVAYLDSTLVFIRFYEANTSHNRVGVRTDTYNILMKHYDPEKIPRNVFLRTLSDHDISFGRAYLGIGDIDTALGWFRQSLSRTPFRARSWRYYLRNRLAVMFRPNKATSPKD
jgi:glycosyltransferase involved in cell wall biosynthesis